MGAIQSLSAMVCKLGGGDETARCIVELKLFTISAHGLSDYLTSRGGERGSRIVQA